MITRSAEFCSLTEVPESALISLINKFVPFVAPKVTEIPEPTAWTHLNTRDERAGLGDGEVVQSYRSSVTSHIRITKTITQRFVDSKFGPIQMGDRVGYLAAGQGENLHFDLYVNTDGNNTVYFMVSATPKVLDQLLEIFNSNFAQEG